MDTLMKALINVLLLKPIDYQSNGKIILSVDSSLIGWEAILQQQEETHVIDASLIKTQAKKKRRMHPARYKREIQVGLEKNYDAGKLEYRDLLKAQKKFKKYLYGVCFLVQIDAKTITYQLNQPVTDLSDAVVNRQLAWIWLFDFKVEHVEEKKHGRSNVLSRRRRQAYDSEESDPDDLNDAIDADVINIRVLNNITHDDNELA